MLSSLLVAVAGWGSECGVGHERDGVGACIKCKPGTHNAVSAALRPPAALGPAREARVSQALSLRKMCRNSYYA